MRLEKKEEDAMSKEEKIEKGSREDEGREGMKITRREIPRYQSARR